MLMYRFLLPCFTLFFSVMPLTGMIHNDSVNFATTQLFTCAATGKDADLIDTFISHGGNIFAKNNLGQTPLDIALQQQTYWNKKATSRSHAKKIKKHRNNFLHVVKKLRYAEQKIKRTIPTKPNKPFNCLCTYAAIEQRRMLDEESQKKSLKHENSLQVSTKITLAQRLLKKREIHNSHYSAINKAKDEESEALDIETDSQDPCALEHIEKSLNKPTFIKPLKERVKLTILIPEKPIEALPSLQAY